ncbi:MAG: DUF4129 domain-containing protein [Polyangia bacterium]
MNRRARLAIALCAALLPLEARGGGDAPANEDVGRSIDEITEPPDYDWLRRSDERGSGGSKEVSPRTEGERPAPKRHAGEDGSCDFEPSRREKERGPGEPLQLPERGRGCGGVPSGGGPSEPGSPAEEGGCSRGGSGCGADPEGCCPGSSPGEGCSRGAGGGCGGCGGAGAVLTPLGYIVAAAGLALLVFLVARAILRRGESGEGERTIEAGGGEPEDVRVSQVADLASETLMDKAARAAAEGRFRAAVGWSYLAGLSMLHRGGFADLRQSTTNLELVDSTRRRGGPHLAAARLVRVFEDVFFGDRPAGEEQWSECRSIVEEKLADAIVEPS